MAQIGPTIIFQYSIQTVYLPNYTMNSQDSGYNIYNGRVPENWVFVGTLS